MIAALCGAATWCLAARVSEMSGTVFVSQPQVESASNRPEIEAWTVVVVLFVFMIRLIVRSVGRTLDLRRSDTRLLRLSYYRTLARAKSLRQLASGCQPSNRNEIATADKTVTK
jgi:hypothetical protein